VSRLLRRLFLFSIDLAWLKGTLTKSKFEELSSLAFIERRENVFFLSSSGIGKTHLLQASGGKACLLKAFQK
jgi:DNA replication protein DnaC